MKNKQKKILDFDQQKLDKLILELDSFEIVYKQQLNKVKTTIQVIGSISIFFMVILAFCLISFDYVLLGIYGFLGGVTLLMILLGLSSTQLEYFAKGLPEIFEKSEKAQEECEEILYKLINDHHVLDLESLLKKTNLEESNLTALIASLVQSEKIIEQLDINSATYVYATDESFFIEMKSLEKSTAINYSNLIAKIQKERYQLDYKYIENFDHIEKGKPKKIFKKSLLPFLVALIPLIFSFYKISFFFFSLVLLFKSLSGSFHEEKISQDLESKNLSEEYIEKNIKDCEMDLENLVLLSILNYPDKSLIEIDSILNLGVSHLQDILNNLLNTNKIKEDIEIENGLLIYSICDDYFITFKTTELEKDIFTRYLSTQE